jgi:hypothetical protein
MGVSPTEPLRCWTAILAFEFNVISAMLWTIFYWNFTAILANQLLWFKGTRILLFSHGFCTVLSPSKVRVLTFETLKICIDCNSILLRFLIVRRFWIFELLIFLTALKL